MCLELKPLDMEHHSYNMMLFWVIVEFFVTVAIGFAAGLEHPYVATALCLGVLPPFLGVCRSAAIEFGPVGLQRDQFAVHAAIAVVAGSALGPAFAFLYEFTDDRQIQILVAVACLLVCGISSSTCGGRANYLVAALWVVPRGLYGIIFTRDGEVGYNPWYGWVLAPWLFSTAFVRYKKDQCTLGMFGVASANCIAWGHALARRPTGSQFFIVVLVIVSYIQLLWMRRGRQLPPGLRGCKFVTLEYLRRVAASGDGIRRCQDLPPDAFAHPHKARYVLAVSHRWLDRYTCDIATDDYPEGLRLHTMVEMLDEYFSLKGFFKGQGFRGRLRRSMMAMTGGRDVALFFDFMSLPQETLGGDGGIQPRTPSEQALFVQSLPNMGALYSMLPVLVCEAATPGVRTYLESGWCFTEVATAWLGGQLKTYSARCAAAQWFQQHTAGCEDLGQLAKVLDEEVNDKHFLRDDDRMEVHNILRGFLTKSALVRALKTKSKEDLEAVLASDVFRVSNMLDQAIDSHLNTPLHLAVAINFPEGVRLLLEAGARKDLRNHNGDLPVERLMLPRLSQAAFTCRKFTMLRTFERLSALEGRRGSQSSDNGDFADKGDASVENKSDYRSDYNSSCSAGTLHASSVNGAGAGASSNRSSFIRSTRPEEDSDDDDISNYYKYYNDNAYSHQNNNNTNNNNYNEEGDIELGLEAGDLTQRRSSQKRKVTVTFSQTDELFPLPNATESCSSTRDFGTMSLDAIDIDLEQPATNTTKAPQWKAGPLVESL